MEPNNVFPVSTFSENGISGKEVIQKHIEKLFQFSIDPACVAGFDGYFKLINPAFSNILGHSNEELLRRPYMDFVHPDDVESTLNEAKKLADRSITTIGFVNRYRKKDGTYVYFEWNVFPDAENQLLYCTIRDITLLVKAEERELKTNKTINLILEGIDAGVWEWNILTGQEWWSDKFFHILDYQPNEITPSYSTFINLLHPNDIEMVSQALETHLEKKEKYILDIRMQTGKGIYKWIQTSGRAEWNEDDKPVRMYGTILDIDEKKKKEIRLKNSIDVINEQNTRLLDFAHIISHNLRSHTSNFGMLIGLYESLPDEDSRTEIFSKIKQNFNNLNESIESLNKVVKIKYGIQEQKEEIDLPETLSRVLKSIEYQIQSSKATINTDFSQYQTIASVPAYMESIFYNLVSNAIKYRHSRRAPIIHISTKLEGGRPVLIIKDNGIGLDMKTHGKKVFGMYKTFHGNPDAKGLGLFMTKNQVEALGGSITWESEPGHGSTFKIYF
ncbi:MAG: PAS domain-containing protein [Bacteroidia bacterium]